MIILNLTLILIFVNILVNEGGKYVNNKIIYTGIIKKCTNLDKFKLHGEKDIVIDFDEKNKISMKTDFYSEILDENAILICITENEYVWINRYKKIPNEFLAYIQNKEYGFQIETLVGANIPIEIISIKPWSNNLLYVDKESLKPYFEKEKGEKNTVKK